MPEMPPLNEEANINDEYIMGKPSKAKENKVGMYSDVDNSYYTTNKNNESKNNENSKTTG